MGSIDVLTPLLPTYPYLPYTGYPTIPVPLPGDHHPSVGTLPGIVGTSG